MSQRSRNLRANQLRQKRKRKQKLKKLREKYILAKTQEEKEKILEKVFKIAPWLTEEEFLKPLRN
ncbi:MAG: DUF6800 family protein [Candidatus Paceibacterota bacterium]